jgi:hypothetical protein
MVVGGCCLRVIKNLVRDLTLESYFADANILNLEF